MCVLVHMCVCVCVYVGCVGCNLQLYSTVVPMTTNKTCSVCTYVRMCTYTLSSFRFIFLTGFLKCSHLCADHHTECSRKLYPPLLYSAIISQQTNQHPSIAFLLECDDVYHKPCTLALNITNTSTCGVRTATKHRLNE